jgi:hypothetical protein
MAGLIRLGDLDSAFAIADGLYPERGAERGAHGLARLLAAPSS